MRGVPQSISTSIFFSSSAIGATARQSPALIEVTQLLDLLGRAAVLVDDNRFDFHAAEPDLLVRSGGSAFVQLVDDKLSAVAGRHAETISGGPGQERDDAQFESLLRQRRRRQGQRRRGDNR